MANDTVLENWHLGDRRKKISKIRSNKNPVVLIVNLSESMNLSYSLSLKINNIFPNMTN